MQTSLVTYCSRDKDPAPGLLPAVDRYLSLRIRAVQQVAEELKVPSHILSGLYGLIESSREIPDYDHLLTSQQVHEHAGLVAGQAGEMGIGRVIFVTRPLGVDPGAAPYRQTMQLACEAAEMKLDILEVTPPELDPARLAARIRKLQV